MSPFKFELKAKNFRTRKQAFYSLYLLNFLSQLIKEKSGFLTTNFKTVQKSLKNPQKWPFLAVFTPFLAIFHQTFLPTFVDENGLLVTFFGQNHNFS